MEIRVWRTSCCTPEASECTGCFRRLKWYAPQMDKQTGQKGGPNRRKESRPEGSSHHAHRGERQQVRRERRKKEGRKKREGGR